MTKTNVYHNSVYVDWVTSDPDVNEAIFYKVRELEVEDKVRCMRHSNRPVGSIHTYVRYSCSKLLERHFKTKKNNLNPSTIKVKYKGITYHVRPLLGPMTVTGEQFVLTSALASSPGMNARRPETAEACWKELQQRMSPVVHCSI